MTGGVTRGWWQPKTRLNPRDRYSDLFKGYIAVGRLYFLIQLALTVTMLPSGLWLSALCEFANRSCDGSRCHMMRMLLGDLEGGSEARSHCQAAGNGALVCAVGGQFQTFGLKRKRGRIIRVWTGQKVSPHKVQSVGLVNSDSRLSSLTFMMY